MAGLIDTVYTFRFLKILSTKWVDMDAYKLGIIDKDGTALKHSSELTSNKEKAAYTPFHRLIFKLKRLMEKIPGGKSFVGRYGTALLLIKENEKEVKSMGVDLQLIREGLKRYVEDAINEECEGGPTNTVKGVAGKDMPLGKGKMQKRKKKEMTEDENEIEENAPIYTYQVIGDVLIRVEEATKKRVVKKRVIGGKRQKKREYSSGKGSRYTRTGNRKLRGGALAKKRRSLKKANRKAGRSSAIAKRRRSSKKSRKYN